MKIISIFVKIPIMTKLSIEKVGSEIKLQTDHMNVLVGTVNKNTCKSFYINLGFWVVLDSTCEDKKALTDKIKRYTSHYIRAIASDLTPEYLYCFVTDEFPENLGIKCDHGYCSFEVTILCKDNIQFKDEELISNILGFGNLIQDKLESIEGFSFTRRKIKLQD